MTSPIRILTACLTWAVLFLLTAILLTPPRRRVPPARSNCFFWALRQWWTRGGYLCFRPSRVWRGPHVLWLANEGAPLEHFIPDLHVPRIGWRAWLLAWYAGHVKKGDV